MYAALLAFGATLLAIGAFDSYYRTNYQSVVIVALSSISLLAILLAWLAVRYDWSLRR